MRFEFAHGSPATGESAVLNGFQKLCRLAVEAGDANEAGFRRLCRLETDSALEDVLEVLGSAALAVATRFRAECLTGEALDREIARNLAQTAAAGSRAALRSSLYERITAGMGERRPFLLKTLLREWERLRIVWFDPNSRPPPIGCGTVNAALLALRPCHEGLPAAVPAAAAGCEVDEFERAAAGTDLLTSGGGDCAFWRPAPGSGSRPQRCRSAAPAGWARRRFKDRRNMLTGSN